MSSRKGRLSPMTGAFAANIETLPTSGGVELAYYSESFNATEGLQNDDVIEHGTSVARDMTLPAPALKRATGGMNVPFDLAHLSFYLQMLCGPAQSEADNAGVFTRVFHSGTDTQRLAAFGLPVTGDAWKLVEPALLNQLTFALTKQDGYRTMDLSFLTPNVETVKTEPAFLAAATTPLAPKKLAGSLGTLSIGGSVLAELIDASFSFSNQGELIDLVDGRDGAYGEETGDTQIRTDLTLRVVNGVGVNDVLDNFQGEAGPTFASQMNFPIDANASLTIDLGACKGERRSPGIASAQRQTFQASFQSYQNGGIPAAIFTLINEVAAL